MASDLFKQMDFACSVLETSSDPSIQSVAIYAEMRRLKEMLRVAGARSKVHVASKTRTLDTPKAVETVAKVYKDYLVALEGCIEHVESTPKKLLHQFLIADRKAVANLITASSKLCFAAGSQLADACKTSKPAGEMDVVSACSPVLEVERVRSITSSTEVTVFRKHWQPLVNFDQALALFRAMKTSRYSYVQFEEGADEAFIEAFESCRLVICDIICARALTRPVPANETPKTLVDKARQQVKELKGTVSLPIKLHMDVVSPVAVGTDATGPGNTNDGASSSGTGTASVITDAAGEDLFR